MPGGTGYLAELANAERMWDLLHRAWEKVRDCPCQHEQRLACHRCLVPFAPVSVGGLSRVSRSAAERHLRAILTSGAPDATPGDTMSWSLTTEEPGLRSPESRLEQSFRKMFTERVTALGATVKETPGATGNRLSITFPGGVRQWTLEPQVQMRGCRPDFVLRSSQGGLPAVAIFTDGWLYHASPAHNRIADDARKRQDLRDSGVIVLGVTAQDVARAQSGTPDAPAWLNDGAIAELMRSGATFRPQNVESIRRGPVDFLLAWIQNPDVDGHRGLANQIPFLFAASARQFLMDATADLAREAALLLLDSGRVPPAGDSGGVSWWWNAGSVGCLTRVRGAVLETALVVDDRADHLADNDQTADGWREWLRISNALNLREQPTIITALSDVGAEAGTHQAEPQTVRDIGFDLVWAPAWRSVHDLAASGAERVFAEQLARYAQRDAGELFPVSVVGYETDEGTPADFAWPDAKIAVFLDLEADDPRVAELPGDWRVFGDDPDAVFAALKEAA